MLNYQLSVRRLNPKVKEELLALFANNRGHLALTTQMDEAKNLLDRTLSLNNRSAAYNRDATSVFDVLLDGRMQCTSGTEFILLHLSTSGQLSNNRQAAVVVQRPQHVLPGVFDKTSQKFALVESTVDGAGRSEMSAGQLPKDTQVILADDHFLFKVLGEAIVDVALMKKQTLERAEKTLGIKQGEITPSQNAPTQFGDQLAVSLFGFGSTSVPQGDIERAKVDQLPSGLTPEQMVAYSQPRPESASPLSRFAPQKPVGLGTAESPRDKEMRMMPDPRNSFSPPQIPSADNRPIEHLLKTAETEVRWFRTYSGDILIDVRQLERIFAKLPQGFREAIEAETKKTPRAIVELINPAGSEGSLGSIYESPIQKQIQAVAQRKTLIEVSPHAASNLIQRICPSVAAFADCPRALYLSLAIVNLTINDMCLTLYNT